MLKVSQAARNVSDVAALKLMQFTTQSRMNNLEALGVSKTTFGSIITYCFLNQVTHEFQRSGQSRRPIK